MVSPIIYANVGGSSDNAENRRIGEWWEFFHGGWMAPKYLERLDRYKNAGAAGIWHHCPGGQDADTLGNEYRFNQFRLAREAGLKVGAIEEYKRLIKWCQCRGLEFYSYIGSPNHLPENEPLSLEDWLFPEFEHCLAYHGRLGLDATWWREYSVSGTNEVNYSLCQYINHSDKGSSPAIVESIPPRLPEVDARFAKFDQCIVLDLLEWRHIKASGDQFAKIWDDDFPSGSIFVLVQNGLIEWSELQDRWGEILEKAKNPKQFRPVVNFWAVDLRLKAGLDINV